MSLSGHGEAAGGTMAGDAANLLAQASAHYRRGRPRDAIACLNQAVSVAPDRPEAWKRRGQIMLEQGAYRDALVSFDRALSADPHDADTLAHRGDALRLLGRGDEAQAAYHRAVGLNGGHARALNGLGLMAANRGTPAAALEYHDRALAIDETFPEAHNGRGLALVRLGDLAGGLASFTQALALWPGYVDALINAGNTLRKLGRLEEALASHERALQLDPNALEALHSHAGVLGALGRLEQAIGSCDRALALDLDFPPVLMRRATFLGLLGRHAEAIAGFDHVLSLPSMTDSFRARAHVMRGNSLRRMDRLSEAVTAYDQALALRPRSADAWAGRGLVLRQLMEPDEALENYDTALEINPRHLEARNARSILLATLGRNEEAEAEARFILSIEPGYGAAFNSLGNALQRQGRIAEALDCFETAIGLVTDSTAARFNYGMCLLLAGDFARGWREYEVRSGSEGWDVGWNFAGQPAWLGKGDIAGKTIMLYSEQGLGDTINFCRYVPMVQALGATVVLAVPGSLKQLLQSLDGASAVVDETQPLPPFDVHCSLMSLPLAFATELSTIPARVPYLAPPEERREVWRDRLGPKRGPRIGLAWSGNDKPLGRSVPLDVIGPLVAMLPEVYCLQRDLRPVDLPALALHQNIRFFGSDLRDFSHTAALMDELDLIISIDTSILHLAGALGLPVWGMLPFAADWRWLLHREDSPWYPTLRLFRQPASGDWHGVIDRIRRELAVFLDSFR